MFRLVIGGLNQGSEVGREIGNDFDPAMDIEPLAFDLNDGGIAVSLASPEIETDKVKVRFSATSEGAIPVANRPGRIPG